jgi:4-aminobutyrate aminotransferase/(S)-3-amino-2-methylpropionate transaminase
MATMTSIQLKTDIPGPKSKAVLDRHERTIAEPLSIYLPLVIAEGRGALLTDLDGNTFIDFTGGIGCLAVGHSHPRVVEAAQEQAALFTHTDYTIVPYENYVGLAERLCAAAPISGEVRAGFFNSGAEAVENAVKFAKSYTKRPAVIAFDGAFHGRTLMAMSLTSKTHPYKAGLGPFAPEVYRVSFADPYRGPDTETALAELRRAFKTRVAAEEVAAIIFEPVQGESGFITPPLEFVQGVREIASEHGIVLIVDEVQTGFGRTGTMFAIEQFGIEPDLMTVAKSVAAGYPLSGVVGRAEIMDAPGDSQIGGTYVGNPVSIAAAHAVLDAIEEERLVERATEIGDTIRQRMEAWSERFSCIGDIRGLGAMLAIEIVRDRDTREPDADLATSIVEAASARGLLLLKAGLYGNCIRVLTPLVVTDEQLDEALGAWEEAFAEATGSHPHVDSAASTT